MGREEKYGYARVSTREQNLGRQIEALLGEGVPGNRIYVDKLSGKDFERPQYQRMIRHLRKGAVLYVKSIDRLGRNYADLNEQWRVITKERGADIVVLDMPILDTRREKSLIGTLISDIVLALLSYVAENERAAIRQRQAEGIALAQEKGIRFGRPPRPIPDNFCEVHRAWREGGMTMVEAAAACGMPPKTFYGKAVKMERERMELWNGEGKERDGGNQLDPEEWAGTPESLGHCP